MWDGCSYNSITVCFPEGAGLGSWWHGDPALDFLRVFQTHMGQGLLEPPVALQPFAVAYPPASEASTLERKLWKRQVRSALTTWEVEVGECPGGFISSTEVAHICPRPLMSEQMREEGV